MTNSFFPLWVAEKPAGCCAADGTQAAASIAQHNNAGRQPAAAWFIFMHSPAAETENALYDSLLLLEKTRSSALQHPAGSPILP
jgi:hypothetical protein